MKSVVFLSGEYSPFMLELAKAINDIGEVAYKVIFLNDETNRPSHWRQTNKTLNEQCEQMPSGLSERDRTSWLETQIRTHDPDVLIIGGTFGRPYTLGKLAIAKWLKKSAKVGFWAEQPLPETSVLRRTLKKLLYKWRLRIFDFCFAIGDRAHAYYRTCHNNTHFVPYGSDLSACFKGVKAKKQDATLKILFSGRLQKRHNFDLIMEALKKIHDAQGPVFEFVISGNGPEQATIDKSLSSDPSFASCVRFDRDFVKWEDRLVPFLNADVFLYPTNHAGWGLIIPEAMASGLPVISSRKAESARYMVSEGENGLFVDISVDAIVEAINHFLKNRNELIRMSENARNTARIVDANYVAEQFMSGMRASSALID